jgi:hypothetical protein
MEWWQLQDPFDFDNIGFSKAMEFGNGRQPIKLLSCGECDLCPLGYQDLTTKLIYLSAERVKYAAA